MPNVAKRPAFRRGPSGRRTPAEIGLILLAMLVAALFLGVPLAVIFIEAFKAGVSVYLSKITEPDTLHAVWLTVLTALVVVPVNMAFGLAAAWLVTRYRFPGRRVLISVIEIPFSVSPIVAGVTYLFLYGAQGLFGPALEAAGFQVMFTVTAIFLVSLFVTSPFVARELIPLMQTQGSDDEEAAFSLGAGGFTIFRRITLPNIRWALLYGAILCNARVMGEFGAVSVVSGSIRGQTNTLPLQIELLFNDYNALGAFAAASVLTFIALLTMLAKIALERHDES
jgi:sulfate transport system permease protein